jgi:hypothetical protein
MSIVFKADTYTAKLDPGVYPAQLVAIEERSGDRGDYLMWHFAILDQDDPNIEITALSSMKFTPQAKARQYAQAILNRSIKPGEEVKAAQFQGEFCQLVLSVETLDDGSTVNRVQQILPLLRKTEEDVPMGRPRKAAKK